MSNNLKVAARTDVGCKRQNNEDSFGYDEHFGIYVVSDGVGGSAAGEIASYTAVRETVESYGRMKLAPGNQVLPMQDLLFHAIHIANSAVYTMSQAHLEMSGMGATMVAVCVDGRNAVVANVGDSRAYLLRNGFCAQITQDHSLAAAQGRLGLLDQAASALPIGNAITRAIGIGPEVEPDLFAAELLPGDRMLLATDGLMRHVNDQEIATLVQKAGADLAAGCNLLIQTTRDRGASDNVTCMLLG